MKYFLLIISLLCISCGLKTPEEYAKESRNESITRIKQEYPDADSVISGNDNLYAIFKTKYGKHIFTRHHGGSFVIAKPLIGDDIPSFLSVRYDNAIFYNSPDWDVFVVYDKNYKRFILADYDWSLSLYKMSLIKYQK